MPKNNSDFFKKKKLWSEVKDQLLCCYLTPYFQKVLRTGKPIFYVDCFAGKGRFDDGEPGSPIIALDARKSCLSKTKSQRGSIEACFIEPDYAEELKENIAGYCSEDGQVKVISGKYGEKIEELLSDKKGYNVFLYIDPYGIKALDSVLFEKFDEYCLNSLEILVNFNSFGFFRNACAVMRVDYEHDEAFSDLDDLVEYTPTKLKVSKTSEDLLTRIAGGDYWKNIVRDYQAGKINGYKAEKRLSTEYKQWLKKRFQFVLDMPIRLKPGNRPKYRMIHVCGHRDGCLLMAKNMLKRKDFLFINVQQRGQLSLADFDPALSSTVENELMSKSHIAELLREHLSKNSHEVRLKDFLASFVSEYGLLCDFGMIHCMLDEMEKCGLIEILRKPNQTQRGKPTTFWEETKGHTVTIRSLIS